ncbi:MAG: LicD family protein [Clostridia bacterium]|nr:LicD family protein [Clostridia bacterium]
MTQQDLNKLHQAQLEIMDEIHRICLYNDIHYYIIGGTCIGAVRHKGFIPWDPDIDIGMLRNDYDRFKEICKKDLSSKFKYYDYIEKENYNRLHAIVSMKNTKLITFCDKYNKFENLGIYVDVLPLDNAPNDIKERKRHQKIIHRCKKKINIKIATVYTSNVLKKAIKKLRSFLFFGYSLTRLNEIFDKCMRKYDNVETNYLCAMAGRYSYSKECVPKDYFGTPVLTEFEGRKYYAPAKTDEYLTHIYGDYMKIPSKEEQDLNLSLFQEVIFNK